MKKQKKIRACGESLRMRSDDKCPDLDRHNLIVEREKLFPGSEAKAAWLVVEDLEAESK